MSYHKGIYGGSYEIFYIEGKSHFREDVPPLEIGWYWWACWPGCLPDGEPNGPFNSEAEAIADCLGEPI
jgi:hypothetical protein